MTPKGIQRESAVKQVGPGWSYLVNIAYNFLPEGAVVTCVKEKFGELRIYVDYADDKYQDLLDILESASGEYCEDCGVRGRWYADGNVTTKPLADGNWIRTLCTKCRETANEKRQSVAASAGTENQGQS